MRIKAIYKKGRFTYPIELVNCRGNPFTGLRDYKDLLTGDWIPQKYICKPKLIEGVSDERRHRMVHSLFNNCYRDPNWVG